MKETVNEYLDRLENSYDELQALKSLSAELVEVCQSVEEAWAGHGDMSVAVDKCLLVLRKADKQMTPRRGA